MTVMNGYCIECGKYTASWVEGTEIKEMRGFDGKVGKYLVCGECVKKRKKKNG